MKRSPAPTPSPHNPWTVEGHLWDEVLPTLKDWSNTPRRCWGTYGYYQGRVLHLEQKDGVIRWQFFRFSEEGSPEPSNLHDCAVVERPCPDCGRGMAVPWSDRNRSYERRTGPPPRCCHCQQTLERQWNRKAARTYRIDNGMAKTPLWVHCNHCGERFAPQRSTARFCSTACRVAAHRAKAKD